jgi:hypothetical protein
MSRLEWILGGILAVLVIALAILLALFWLRPEGTVNNPVTSAVTARESYRLAETAARQWAADALLVNARATWTPESNLRPDEAAWDFIFYSPAQSAIALIAVRDSQANILNTSAANQAFTAGDLEQWQVDSPAALETVLASGGRSFREQEGQTTIILTFNAGEMAWLATLINATTRQTLTIRVNANSGEVTETQQSS